MSARLPDFPIDLFALPRPIAEDPTCADLRAAHSAIVSRLQVEIAALPLSTLHLMVLQRLVSAFFFLIWRERLSWGEAGAYQSASQENRSTLVFLDLVKTLYSVIRTTDDAVLGAIKVKLARALDPAIATLPNEQQQTFREHLSLELDYQGL